MQLPLKQIALSVVVIAASGAYVWEQAAKGHADDILGSAPPADAAKESPLQPVVPAAAVSAGHAPTPALPLPKTRRQSVQFEPRMSTLLAVGKETTAAIESPAQKPALAAMPEVSSAPVSPPEAVAAPLPATPSFAITPAVYIPIPPPRPAYPDAPARVIRVGTKLTAHGFADGTYTGPVADAYYGLIQIQASIRGGRLTTLKVLRYPNDRRTSISINRQALPMLRDEAISAQSANVDIISGATLTSRAFRQSLAGALKQASS